MVRITQNLLSNRTLANLQQNIRDVARIQDQLSTGRRINNPSDDASAFPLALNLRSNIHQSRVFQNNVGNARTNLELSETSLNSLTEVLQEIRSLAVRGANDLDTPARQALGQQVEELFGQIMDLSNSNFNGQFIFGGSQTKSKPFVIKDGVVKYKGDDFKRNVTIGKGFEITTNINGNQAFLHTPNQITASVGLQDSSAPLAEQLRLAHDAFPNLPPLPESVPGASVDRSPNPNNFPGTPHNNLARFRIYGVQIEVDLSKDSLEDVQNRINDKVDDVVASINSKNQLVITSRRSDALDLEDGAKQIGYPPGTPQQANLLSALGMHRRIENQRALNFGFPVEDPLLDGTLVPPPQRGAFQLKEDAFLFAAANTGPDDEPAIPFADNMAISDIDADGNEAVDSNNNPQFVDDLEAIRITIDDEVIDIDMRALTTGIDFDGVPGNADDIPGSRLEDMLSLINNHPQLQGRATAFINADRTGIGISAVESVDQFVVESVRKLFGRDITTQVSIQPVTGTRTVTRTDKIEMDTLLDDLPGAVIDPTVNPNPGDPTTGSLGIRRPDPLPAGLDSTTNEGFIVIENNGNSEAIDLRETQTVGDVIQTINDSKAGVKAEINENGTGINITSLIDHDNRLQVMDMADGTIARDLGLFTPPPPKALSSDVGLTVGNTVAVEAPAASAGEFTIEVRDNSGRTLEEYSIAVDPTDTIQDIVDRIDAIDGESGPGKGLLTANFTDIGPPAGNTLNVVSNFDGHTIFIDPADDTTGTTAATRFTQIIGLAGYTAATDTQAQGLEPYVSEQDTAGVIGLNGEGSVTEIEEHNLFSTVKDLERAMRNDDTEAIQQAIEDLDIDLDKVLNTRTILGSRLNRLDSADIMLDNSENFLRQDLSRVEDADLAALITDFNLAQNAFQAALSASARVLQQSLINFLR